MAPRPSDARPTLVVGAGVVGLACAVELARAGHWVVLSERERRYGRGTSSRNSGVIHAGLYYQPGSLKARLCVEGRDRLYAYARSKDVLHRRCGKLVVATASDEIPELEALAVRARANGVEDVALIGQAEVQRLAPCLTAVAALQSPSTGIVDPHALMDALAAEAASLGVGFVYHSRVVGAEPIGGGWRVSVRSPAGEVEEIEAEWVVNAAGLYADELASIVVPDVAAAGLATDWVKGNYFTIRPAAHAPVDCLVYPCPRHDLRGLGIHLTLDLDGGQRLGPNVEMLPDRVERYDVDPALRDDYLAAARTYLPHLVADDLEPAFAGIRPQRRVPGYRDFYIAHEAARGAPGWVNLVAIDSPGLTAALAIAPLVARLVAS